MTPLHMAALNGYMACCRKLFLAGIDDINAKDDYGRTAVHLAAYGGYLLYHIRNCIRQGVRAVVCFHKR